MRAPRRVTLQPIGQALADLEGRDALRDLVIERLLAGDLGQSATAAPWTFLSATASPTPMLIVILVMRGTCIGFASSNSLASACGTTVLAVVMF